MGSDPAGVSMPASRARPQTVAVVLGASHREQRRHLMIALGVALALHGALWFCAARFEGERESWSVARAQAQLSPVTTVDLAVPAPAPPVPPEQKVQVREPIKQPAAARIHAAPRQRAESSAPPAPAQAGAIVAQETSSPVDLTSDAFVTGTAKAFAGGVTASKGTNARALQTRDVVEGTPPLARIGARDRSGTVSLESQNWSCPWPREADAEQIDEQTVIIRVVVAADGEADSAEVVADPGHGFGQSATSCALRTRFSPARDRNGDPIRARSPPIRVRFTR